MAVRAVTSIYDIQTNESYNTKFDAYINYCVLLGDIGDLDGPHNSIAAFELTPGLLNDVNSSIKAAVKADMETHGITFDVLDTVQIY